MKLRGYFFVKNNKDTKTRGRNFGWKYQKGIEPLNSSLHIVTPFAPFLTSLFKVGKLGPDMLARLWASATSELSREQRQAAAALLPSNDANTSSSSSNARSSALETGTNERREIVRAEGAAVVVVRETPAKVPKLKKHEVLVLVTCPDACTGNDSLEIVVSRRAF